MSVDRVFRAMVVAALVVIITSLFFMGAAQSKLFDLQRDQICLTSFDPVGDVDTAYTKEVLRLNEKWC